MADMTYSILPVRPGTLSTDDRAALREAGVIVIEHENPAELQMLAPVFGDFPGGPVLDAAVEVLAMFQSKSGHYTTESDHMRSAFVAKLAALRKKEKAGG